MSPPQFPIPMAKDVARAIGAYGEKIENRSLLLEKFPIHKEYGFDRRFHDASRHSLLRVSENGSAMLKADADDKKYRAGGRNVNPNNKESLLKDAAQAEILARTSCQKPELLALRAKQAEFIREKTLASYGDNGFSIIAKLEGRMAINLAEGLIQNAGICLDRLFGLPYIPGSAVKGIARHSALWNIKELNQDKREDALITFAKTFGFGTVETRHPKSDLAWALDDRQDKLKFEQFVDRLKAETKAMDNSLQGGISFFPAYPISPDAKIVVDLTNAHYPDYYRSQNLRDLSKENPRPNPFPVVEKGTSFSFLAVVNGTGFQHSNPSGLLEIAKDSLSHALTRNGVGAKTAAGYGWFSIPHDKQEES
jgi:CRISPR type III-B/RAMP module RAMP protein Cmr6